MKNKSCICMLFAIWVVLLLGLLLLDEFILQDTLISGTAQFRLTAISTDDVGAINEGVTYDDLCNQIGLPTGADDLSGSIRMSWDLEWGQTLWVVFMPNRTDYIVSSHQITEPFDNYRWLLLPGVMLFAALIELTFYSCWRKKRKNP